MSSKSFEPVGVVWQEPQLGFPDRKVGVLRVDLPQGTELFARAGAPLAEPTRDEILKLWNLAMLETADGLDAMQYYTRAILWRYGRT